MRQRNRSRQLFLIVIAIVLPAAVLVGLARRVVRQERELAAARAAEEHRNANEQLRRELAAKLETVKLQEVNRWIRLPNAPDNEEPPDPSLVFVAAVDGDRMILPWERESEKRPPALPYAQRLREGESLEFIRKDFAAALTTYRVAKDEASRQNEICEAMLREARVLVKAERKNESAGVYRTMLKNCYSAVDDDGVPLGLYAAERLIDVLKQPELARRYVVERIRKERWLAPNQAFMMRTLLDAGTSTEVEPARRTINSRIEEIGLITAFAREFHRVRPLAETAWVAYGAEPWLVTVIAPEPPLPSLVFVVSSAAAQQFISHNASLVKKETEGSEPLGAGFVGMNVMWNGEPAARIGGSSSLYTGGIAFILGVTVLSGYLLLRDVNRDLRLAELRSNFVASVSHELKTPLTAIRMFAETLALGRARDERTRSEYLETIVNESERLARLVDNVLDFSKIEQGKKIYRLQPTRLADVLQSAARAMHYPLAQQGFALRVSIDETADSVPIDADAMEQAILNLLSNAMKYSGDERNIELSLKIHETEAVISVTDHGIGIDPDEQPLIFEKFYRGRSTAAAMVAGTGLGLTVVQHVVEAHRGRVELRSAKGTGSTFSIRIPLSGLEVRP
jgi:two-component sensor histidine kinase